MTGVQTCALPISGIFCFIIFSYKQWFSDLISKAKQLAQKKMNKNKKVANVFNNNYIDVRTLFLKEYNEIPRISFINDLNAKSLFDFIKKGGAGEIVDMYQRLEYDWIKELNEFDRTVFIMKDRIMIELGYNWAEILCSRNKAEIAEELLAKFKLHKSKESEDEFNIHIITIDQGSLDLKQLEIKPAKLDVELFYNDDFKEVDAVIKERLSKDNDKGIVLLHGLSGTGKTTYLRHLIGSLTKKVLFVSPAVASNLMNPEFMDLLLDHPNSVLVIEDAENIIMDRKYSSYSSVSNLLNISDGLLSDCLNVQIICTFNSALNVVDSALLRKGRLIAKYEFGKLDTTKAQKLSDHLGLDQLVVKPLTLAELTNPDEMQYDIPQVNVIGFRREANVMMG